MKDNSTPFTGLSADLYLTDGGLETTLVFLEGYDLPCFAAFDLLKEEKGYAALKNYYRRYLEIAKDNQAGFILESPTWRANPDWMEKIGYPATAIGEINAKAIQLLAELRTAFEGQLSSIILSGCIGPRGDGYKPGQLMTATEAKAYHLTQIHALSQTPVQLISAITMNYAEEALGIALAAAEEHLPAVISFTVETDGRLATGMHLKEAIEMVDDGATVAPLYYMINCAHPTHFRKELEIERGQPWTNRIRGIRANASCKSHAELDEATELDRGDPREFGAAHKELKQLFSGLTVFGGCCGTDEEHVMEMVNQLNTLRSNA